MKKSAAVHPQCRAAEFAKELKDRWAPAAPLKTFADILTYTDWIPSGGYAFNDAPLNGQALRKIAPRMRDKAAGTDSLTANMLLLLPDRFWELLADVMQVMRDTGRVPRAWLDVRIGGIDKSDGGARPLGIAALCYWISMCAVMMYMANDWADLWVPPELVGGLRGRSAVDSFVDLEELISNGLAGLATIAGAKIDLKKCFDTVVIEQAVELWRLLGAPEWLCQLLLNFYQEMKRYVEVGECVHPDPIIALRGLLQGCPCRVLLFSGIMTCWRHFVMNRHPSLTARCYIGDRCFQAVGDACDSDLRAALATTAEADTDFGLEEHPDKRELWSTNGTVRKRMRDDTNFPGNTVQRFTALGGKWETTKKACKPMADAYCAEAH